MSKTANEIMEAHKTLVHSASNAVYKYRGRASELYALQQEVDQYIGCLETLYDLGKISWAELSDDIEWVNHILQLAYDINWEVNFNGQRCDETAD